MENIAKLPQGLGYYNRTSEINLDIDEAYLGEKQKNELLEIENNSLKDKYSRLNELLTKKQASEKNLIIKLKKLEIKYNDLLSISEEFADCITYDGDKIEFLEETLTMYMKNYEIVSAENKKVNSLYIKLLELKNHFTELSNYLNYKRNNLLEISKNYMNAPYPDKEKSAEMISDASKLEKMEEEAKAKLVIGGSKTNASN